MTDVALQRKSLPNEPGVYLFKDRVGKVIYVGKASNLKKRVNQYFLKTSYIDPYYEEKIKELVKRITTIEYIVTENEKEALILENIQIKTHKPLFNVHMKDSKSYPYVAIFYSEEYPRIKVIRGPEKYTQNNLVIGPYTDKKEIQRILRDLRKIFPYCTCKKPTCAKDRSCIYYQLNLCPGPCIEKISKQDYLENIRNIELFLKGETKELFNQIEEKMRIASKAQDYELAAVWRDKLSAIKSATTQQHVIIDQQTNKDIIGTHLENKFAAFVILYIRGGRISNKNSFLFDLRDKLIQKNDILPSMMEQYYQDTHFDLPDEIIIPNYSKKLKSIINYLKDIKPKIRIRSPMNEHEKALLRITIKNAKVLIEQKLEMEELRLLEKSQLELAMNSLKEKLHLPQIPKSIEGFDISNIEGGDATGSMVYFFDGKPLKKNYRHYKIRTKTTPDDVFMMKEVINRRYSYLVKNDKELPDLILVDGGKGQLNGALLVLKELGLESIPIIGLAKRLEEVFLPNKKNPVILSQDSPELHLLQRIRDEAHRFAVRLHKKQRQKRIRGSLLEEIEGIGPKTRNKLLNRFGSVAGLKRASQSELRELLSEKLVIKVLKKLREI